MFTDFIAFSNSLYFYSLIFVIVLKTPTIFSLQMVSFSIKQTLIPCIFPLFLSLHPFCYEWT